MEANGQVLEITLISAQGLMKDSSKARSLKTYALACVDPANKLRTQVDQSGGSNPTWNARFTFRVRSEFLASETSAISFEIYSVGLLRDKIIGSVRFLISNFLPVSARSGFIAPMKTPSFTALQIRRPSGSFYGVLNIAAMVLDGPIVPALDRYGASSLHHRELAGRGGHERQQHPLEIMMPKSMRNTMPVRYNDDGGSSENSVAGSWDGSDGGGSTTSSSSSAASTALKDWNGVASVLAGKHHVRRASEGGRILCGLPLHKKMFL